MKSRLLRLTWPRRLQSCTVKMGEKAMCTASNNIKHSTMQSLAERSLETEGIHIGG